MGAVPDAVAFVREAPEGSVLVLVARDASDPITVDAAFLPGVEAGRAVEGDGISVAGGAVTLASSAPGISLWVW